MSINKLARETRHGECRNLMQFKIVRLTDFYGYKQLQLHSRNNNNNNNDVH